ncbi:MAG: DUF937 domain-containing protein [Methyloceanibacter sp.]
MATNLVSEIAKVLGPDVEARIASSLGLDKTVVQGAVEGGVPGLLAALISLVSKPQGATKLGQAVAQQEPGVLSSLASVIGGSGQKALVETGASALTSLLGGNTMSALTNAIGSYAGIGGAGSKSLIGLLGPVVLGVLGQHQRTGGLDTSGLARLLTSQKDNVLAAVPSGFSKYLKDTGILDGVTSSVPKPAYQTPPRSTSSIWPWLLGALAVIGLGAFAWHLMSGRHAEGPKTAVEAPSPGDMLDKLRGVKVGDVDIGALAKSAVDDLRSSLKGIKDEATAQAAVPELTKDASEFDQLTALLGQLSPETRKALAGALVAIKPRLDKLFDQALALPGVGPVIKPTLDTIRSKLNTLTTT